jgi:hypothetical protein
MPITVRRLRRDEARVYLEILNSAILSTADSLLRVDLRIGVDR